jgi:hypothetical protein
VNSRHSLLLAISVCSAACDKDLGQVSSRSLSRVPARLSVDMEANAPLLASTPNTQEQRFPRQAARMSPPLDGADSVDKYSSLTAAVASIGSTATDLLINIKTICTENTTVPATLRLVFTRAGRIDLGTYSLQINGPFAAGLFQVFTGVGTVSFAPDSTDYLYPHWWGAKGDGIVDSTSALQAAVESAEASRNKTIFLANGHYKVTGTVTIKQGIMIVGPGTQGSNESYGTVLKHYANSGLFLWNGNGREFAGTGGGLKNVLILKASGHSGGDAIRVVSTDNAHRPGEMSFENILIYGDGTGLWGRGFVVDGTASNDAGGRGVRSIWANKLRIAGCDGVKYPNQALYLKQVTHFYSAYLELDPGTSKGPFGMTLDANWDKIFISGAEINGNVVLKGPAEGVTYSPEIHFTGTIAGDFQKVTPLGSGLIDSNIGGSILNHAGGIRIPMAPVVYTLNAVQKLTTGNAIEHLIKFDGSINDSKGEYDSKTGRYIPATGGLKGISGLVTLGKLAAENTRFDIYYRRYNSSNMLVHVSQSMGNPYASSTSAGGYCSLPFHFEDSFNHGDYATISIRVSGNTPGVEVRTGVEGTLFKAVTY